MRSPRGNSPHVGDPKHRSVLLYRRNQMNQIPKLLVEIQNSWPEFRTKNLDLLKASPAKFGFTSSLSVQTEYNICQA